MFWLPGLRYTKVFFFLKEIEQIQTIDHIIINCKNQHVRMIANFLCFKKK